MIRFLIAEDDPQCFRQLEEFLDDYSRETGRSFQVTHYDNGEDLVERYRPGDVAAPALFHIPQGPGEPLGEGKIVHAGRLRRGPGGQAPHQPGPPGAFPQRPGRLCRGDQRMNQVYLSDIPRLFTAAAEWCACLVFMLNRPSMAGLVKGMSV